jgi:hypothetical protein
MKKLLVLFLLISSCAYAQQSENSIRSLRGLKGVWVLVEFLATDIEAVGLSKDNIQTDVELKLRLAGIKVLTKEEWLIEPGSPRLYIRVGYIRVGSTMVPLPIQKDDTLYAYSIEVELHQNVFLERDPKIYKDGATTWGNGSVGVVGEEKILSIRDHIKDNVDEFINDYLSVNPKK